MRSRIEQELAVLRPVYRTVDHVEQAGEDWFRLDPYPLPLDWRIGIEVVTEVPIAFLIKPDYPGSPPYGFLTPSGMNFKGTAPKNTGNPPKPVPFEGDWLHFSWEVRDWSTTSEVTKGSNLLAWSRSFAVRLKEGV